MEKCNVIYYNSTLLKGGTDVYMLDLIRHIDKEKFQVDVIIKDGDKVDEMMLLELESLGSKVFLAKGSFLKRMLYLRSFFKKNKNKYQVAHINATSQRAGIVAYFAKHNGEIGKIIFHSHMGGNDNGKSFFDKIGFKLMLKNASNFAACSSEAREFMFEKKISDEKVLILNNSVDTAKFKFDKSVRQEMRDRYGLASEDVAILHVGRFAEQKNHKKLILIFNEYLKERPSAKLFLIGDGVLFDEVVDQVNELEIGERVIFLRLQNNINEFMCMADCLVMPSIHEGLPIVAVEAQASDLPCVFSDAISREAKLIEDVSFVSLLASKSEWCKEINKNIKKDRKSNENLFKKLGFDKESSTKTIEELYLK